MGSQIGPNFRLINAGWLPGSDFASSCGFSGLGKIPFTIPV
ncbi:hypothetical protein NSU_0714 [Novosphingobium pentaromativorans US6-1]|uniref:Uncharacterized protein n=1 Tax=Novosphingobium pentaromativorans US6-1 TaxID=1088721 RepID=G6E8P3_9SPHN|nr:hypothetical protein NSU_0714 [Novosphingobium pentaromativorans US6-1]